jgi:hypothetical protein
MQPEDFARPMLDADTAWAAGQIQSVLETSQNYFPMGLAGSRLKQNIHVRVDHSRLANDITGVSGTASKQYAVQSIDQSTVALQVALCKGAK